MDLSTCYMGLRLKNPVVASASPHNGNLDHIARLEEAGVAAIVLPSLFEEQIDAASHALRRLASLRSFCLHCLKSRSTPSCGAMKLLSQRASTARLKRTTIFPTRTSPGRRNI